MAPEAKSYTIGYMIRVFTKMFGQVTLEKCWMVALMKEVLKGLSDQKALQQSRIEMSTLLKYL